MGAMKEQIFKNAHIVFAILGLILSICGYVIDNFLIDNYLP